MSEEVQDLTQNTASVITLGAIPPAQKKIPSAPAAQPIQEKKLVMPIANERMAREARRRSIAKQRLRGGRASTILTERETLG